jgi:katanin p80 WD40 repeat-containing subunit B1
VESVRESSNSAASNRGADGGDISPANRVTPVIPAQRDKPVGLNLDAFLPASAAPTEDVNDSEILESIETGHGSMIKVLQLRLRNTQIVRARWESGDYKAAVDTLIDLADQAVLVDVMNIMVAKASVWSLELSATLMPQIVGLLG